MRLVDMTCPQCGALLQVDDTKQEAVCSYCGAKLLIDDGEVHHHVHYDNAEDAGYKFEKGRQRAQAEAWQSQRVVYPQSMQRNESRRNTWLWVLGWLFFFPAPLTVLIWRKVEGWQSQKTVYPRSTQVGESRSNTWLWVLGWLFFFPAPVMVLIWRKSNTWDVKNKIIVTVIFWLAIFIIGALGDREEGNTDADPSTNETVSVEKTAQYHPVFDARIKTADPYPFTL